jgi:hypothetical protein
MPDLPNPRQSEPAPHADVTALLGAYAAVLKLATRPPATLVMPSFARRLKFPLCRLRPVWGTEMWTRRIIRQRLTFSLERTP